YTVDGGSQPSGGADSLQLVPGNPQAVANGSSIAIPGDKPINYLNIEKLILGAPAPAPSSPPTLGAIPDQTMSRSQGTLTITLAASDPDGDPLSFAARADTQAYGLEQQYGFYYTGSYYTNSAGLNEKWFASAAHQWYFLLPDGELHHWDGSGSASGPLVATVPTGYYAHPTTLFNPHPGRGPAAGPLPRPPPPGQPH